MDYEYETPSRDPKESRHWNALDHREGDTCLDNDEELADAFSRHMELEARLGLWSCLFGYCEALTTSKSETLRYGLFPIPFDALKRLVEAEFKPPEEIEDHRKATQAIANWVWSSVKSKAVKDELHANSVYTVLKGEIDGKSVDCFGAALSTVIGLRQVGFSSSTLTLSEDHAYESHEDGGSRSTCEVAIPGNTKAQRSKRGQEIKETFDSKSSLTPETSWLYMGVSPVYCSTPPMILAAALANINPLIESNKLKEIYSEPLMVMKRNLLWILKDNGHLDMFPFALCELGYAEEHLTSPRCDCMVDIPELASVPVTTMEALYHEAIVCSQTEYGDRQVYPYCYMGFFHKDGGQEAGQEDRLAAAVRFYANAAQVASRYKYEWGDSLQLTKVMDKVSEFILREVLNDPKTDSSRSWNEEAHAIDTAKWLICFFDHLLKWEEVAEASFLPLLKPNHPSGIKSLALFQHDVRQKAFASVRENISSCRMQGILGKALQQSKVAISDMHLTIVSDTGRRRKRKTAT